MNQETPDERWLKRCNKRVVEQLKLQWFASQGVSLFFSQKRWPSTMFTMFPYIQSASKTSNGF
jgi:hypothetical protein